MAKIKALFSLGISQERNARTRCCGGEPETVLSSTGGNGITG